MRVATARNRIVRTGCAVALLALVSVPAAAATVYIRDQLYVPLRAGQSENERIVQRGLVSGTPLELLETVEETGYSRIRMENGTEGWIQTQYLTDQPVARDRLIELEKEYAELEKRFEQRGQELKQAQGSRSDHEEATRALNSEIEELERKNEDIGAELSRITRLATDTVQLDEQNKALKAENRSLGAELENLSAQNAELRGRRQQEWFWLGAGTVLASLLLGIWVGRKIYLHRNTGGWS